MQHYRLAGFSGRILIVGFGSVGQGVLPLLLRHIEIDASRIRVLADSPDGMAIARSCGVEIDVLALTEVNFRPELTIRLSPGDVLLNLAVNVSSVALLELCHELGVLYLDTCIEPWPGCYLDARLPLAARTNYALRERALQLRKRANRGPTAILTHGANPGLVSHFLKHALLELAADAGFPPCVPDTRAGWAELAARLDVRTIHIAERDTQISQRRKKLDEFVNTWSIEGFVSEACQPAELGWGTHERSFPPDGARHPCGDGAAIYLCRPGASTRVRTWTPLAGPQHGFLITHAESISIASYLTLGDPTAPSYRPTVLYAYHPCDDAVLSIDELAEGNWRVQRHRHLLRDDLVSGADGLGVLLMGPGRRAFWWGSILDIQTARALCPNNNATSLQVTAAVMSAAIWAIRHPDRGILEPDELPHAEIMNLAAPYLGRLGGVYTDWTPIKGRSRLMDERVDESDPWQFQNFRVA